MTHPKARTRRRARSTRAEQQRYRLTVHGHALLKLPAPGGEPLATCVYCGCTDERACPGGCSWLIVDRRARRGICTNCARYPAARIPTHDNEIAARNRRALAQLRAMNNALIAAGLPPAPRAGK